jgi:serine protease Do
VKSLLIATPLGCIGIVLLFAFGAPAAGTVALPDIIDKIKPAIVAVGAFQKTPSRPRFFAALALSLRTVSMWLPTRMLCRRSSTLKKGSCRCICRQGKSWRSVKLQKSGKIATHDLAILRIIGRPLTTMTLGDANRVREGKVYAFTGFPIGMVLGLNVVTHRGIISAITPIVIAQLSGQLLEKKIISRLTARVTRSFN